MIRAVAALFLAAATGAAMRGAHPDGPSSVQLGPQRARIVWWSEWSDRPAGGDRVCVITVPLATLRPAITCKER